MDYPIPIPRLSERAAKAHQQATPQNPGLLFDRFGPDWTRPPTRDRDFKREGLETVIQAATRADLELLRAWNTRWAAGAEAVQAAPMTLRTDWRLIAGLGRKGPLEVGFTFHRYGFPVLPGSSVKGLARSYALLVHFKGRKEKEVEADPTFAAIFGRGPVEGQEGVEQAGGAVFLEAIPDGERLPKLELDIMNPHVPRYYQEAEAPTNWQNPVPVPFLTVAAGVAFRFAVGWRTPLDDTTRKLRDQARDWLVGGLTEMGAGSKTSAGYGYFVPEAGRTAMPQPEPPRTTSTPTTTPPPVSTPTSVTRRGVIVEIRPDQRRGKVRDAATGQEYPFETSVIQGNTPARRADVEFDLKDGRVIRLKRAEA